MQATHPPILPVLASMTEEEFHLSDPDTPVVDRFTELLVTAYSFGPPFGDRLVRYVDLHDLGLTPPTMRRLALENLESRLDLVEVHGQAPMMMVSFAGADLDGIESSLLLADDLWERLEGAVPGELVVGVPARHVVIVTGRDSQPGIEKARRACDRIFFAGDQHLLSQGLLVRRGSWWEPL